MKKKGMPHCIGFSEPRSAGISYRWHHRWKIKSANDMIGKYASKNGPWLPMWSFQSTSGKPIYFVFILFFLNPETADLGGKTRSWRKINTTDRSNMKNWTYRVNSVFARHRFRLFWCLLISLCIRNFLNRGRQDLRGKMKSDTKMNITSRSGAKNWP